MNLELLASTTHGFVVLKNEKQYNKALNILEKNGFDIESVNNIVCFEEGVTDCLEVYGDISFGIFDSWMKNHVDYTEYGFEEIFGNEVSFKTEDELIEYAIKNKLRVHTKTFEEYCCLMMLYERNGVCYITGIKPTNNIEYCWNIYAENNYNILHSREKMYRGDVTFLKNHEEDAVIDFETFYEMLE